MYLALILFTVSTALAADFSGPVVSVLDGDTLEVLHNHHAERIRQNIGDPCGGERPGGCVPLTHAGNRPSNGRAGGWTWSLIIEAIWQAGCRSRPGYSGREWHRRVIEIRSFSVVTSCIRTVPLRVRFVKLGCPLEVVLIMFLG